MVFYGMWMGQRLAKCQSTAAIFEQLMMVALWQTSAINKTVGFRSSETMAFKSSTCVRLQLACEK